MMEFSAVVLAGGASRRMGLDKRFLSVGGQPLVAWVIDRLRPLVGEVVLVSSTPEAFNDWDVRITTDQYAGQGVLAGVHAGLAAARGAWAYVMAADLPLLNPALLAAMGVLAGQCTADVIVPQWHGELEPLHALYRPAVCAPAAEQALLRGERRIVSFYPNVRVEIMPEADVARWDPSGASFFNVNTLEDWRSALLQLGFPPEPISLSGQPVNDA